MGYYCANSQFCKKIYYDCLLTTDNVKWWNLHVACHFHIPFILQPFLLSTVQLSPTVAFWFYSTPPPSEFVKEMLIIIILYLQFNTQVNDNTNWALVVFFISLNVSLE